MRADPSPLPVDLDALLRRAAQGCGDQLVAGWLIALAEGEGAASSNSAPAALVAPDGSPDRRDWTAL